MTAPVLSTADGLADAELVIGGLAINFRFMRERAEAADEAGLPFSPDAETLSEVIAAVATLAAAIEGARKETV